ncbi:MAG: hypothetical protein IKL62_04225 [Clostridia bacterium]|nr:hypothetical protein [Clostridia bacterium]
MKKISLIMLLALCITIGGVYATWVYSQSDDVADITGATAVTMTEATFTGTYGTYNVDASGLTMVVDPKEGTTHTTALKIDGDLVIKFTPNTYAPADVKTGGVPSTFAFSLSNANWQYEGQNIMTVDTEKHNIVWTPDGAGAFTYTIPAADLANYIRLTEFTLDTKAEYDAYDLVLTNGQIVVSVSDGKNASTIVNN